MSYHYVSHIGCPVRVPIGPDMTLGDEMGAVPTTFAGFTADDIGAYLFSGSGANKLKYARLLIRLANGGPLQSQEEADVIAKWKTRQKKASVVPLGTFWTFWDQAMAALKHLTEHPKGSKVKGGFGTVLKNIGLNIATGGLYSIGKAVVSVAKGGSVLKAGKEALASQGIAGGILTPAVGVDKSLALQSLVAGSALVSAAKAGALTGPIGQAAPTALSTATKLITAAPPSSGDYGPDPFGPALPQPMQPIEAGMFGGLSPMMLGLLFGVPLVIQLFLRSPTPTKRGRP